MKATQINVKVLSATLMAIACMCQVRAQEPASSSSATGVQPERGEASDYNEKVLVTAPYQPSLGSLTKPVFQPKTVDSTVRTSPMTYDILSRPLSTAYPVENIKAAKMVGEPIEKLRNNTVRLGFGYPLTPFAELNFGVGRNRKYDFAAALRHYSTFQNFKDYKHYTDENGKETKFNAMDMLNEAHVTGSILSDKFTSTLDISYRQRMVDCYGLNDSAYQEFLTERDYIGGITDFENQPRRWYQSARAVLTFKDNARHAEDLRFDAYLDYNLNMTNWSATQNESNLVFGGTVGKQILDNRKRADAFSVAGFLRFEDNMYRDGVDDGNWDQLSDTKEQSYIRGNKIKNAYHLQFGPRFHYTYDFVELSGDLGFHVYGNGKAELRGYYKEIKDSACFWFTPVIDLKLHIIPGAFTFFMGTDGGVERNTVESLSQINPYLHPLYFPNFRFTVDKFSAYAGFFGNFSRHIDFRIKAEARWVDNMMSFDYYRYTYNNSYYGPQANIYGYNDFIPEYYDVFHFRARADINFRWDERIKAHVDATYNYYSKSLLYKPAFEANISFKYNLAANRLSLYTNLAISTPVKALDRWGKEVKLNKAGVYDWSLGAEYRFLKRMTAFVNVNNILCQKYYIWNDYRSYRINFLAGLTFDF